MNVLATQEQTLTIDGWTLHVIEDEPRVRDVELAERLGYERAVAIRELIRRWQSDLGIVRTVRIIPEGRGRPGTEFWLTEEQALFVCTKSETPKAVETTKLLIRVFVQARKGLLAPATSAAVLTVDGIKLLARDIVEPVLSKMEQFHERTDRRVGSIEGRLVKVEQAVGRRRELRIGTKDQHVRAERAFGGVCPCCGIEKVLDAGGARLPSAQFDHFYSSQKPDVEHTWLICGRCHADFTYGRVARDQRTPEFAAYQSRRRRLPGGQQRILD